MAFFKKKGGGQVATSGIQMTDSEAALAQSDFNIEKITEIQNRFTGGMVLLYPGRIFIREGLLWKMCRKGPKKRQFFLFNDILVYGSVVANRYSNQHILPLSQMSVSAECFYQPRVNAEFDEDSEQMELDPANAFQISHADKSFHVFSSSSADKANWLANLHKHINKVAQSVSNDKQMVTKPVWVPDSLSKECMVCSVKFTAFIRKHHCRRCGRVICSACSPHRLASSPHSHSNRVLSETKKLERVCTDCFKDMSTIHSRSSGLQIRPAPPPPAAVAPEVVSSVLAASTPSTKSLQEGNSHDSSTDTEDSDDSENEQQEVVSKDDLNTNPVPIPESETQPTPPPRKKKLKKKLEQLVEKQLDQSQIKNNINDGEKEDIETIQNTGNEGDIGTEILKTVEDETTEQGTSPKKRMRRKKHNAVPEDIENADNGADKLVQTSSEAVKVTDETDNERKEDMERHPSVDTSGTKKIRSRKTKFK